MDNKIDLSKLRAQIDCIDTSIQQLISQRAEIASSVAQTKAKSASGGAFYRPEREAQVLRAVKERNNGPLKDATLVRLFREIMSACLAQQKPLNIAYLGPAGTFSEIATYNYFGHSVAAMPVTSIDSVFAEVEAGIADFGMVPVENSTEGAVNNTLDMFITSPLKICGELDLPIHHNLMSKNKDIQAIKTVFSHRQSLAQCRTWLKENLPHAECIAVSSNAEAAKRAQYSENCAAIASESAAHMYGLKLLHSEIEDRTDNSTRFIVIGKQLLVASGDDKTSLLVAAKEQPGALFQLLKPLHECGINMTRIESRPSKIGKWDYIFYIDIDGHCAEENLAKALRLMQRVTTQFKILGSYPKSVT
ncbi:MAG: prephenate dehydratase [Proteobacteria bacterium]|nr:prephenate dehydratase [Pseudomonadota bacterium]